MARFSRRRKQGEAAPSAAHLPDGMFRSVVRAGGSVKAMKGTTQTVAKCKHYSPSHGLVF